eukprot:Gb_35766 [translate_table: standard]
MMLSIFIPFCPVGYPRFGPNQGNNGCRQLHWRECSGGFTRVDAMCKAEGDITTVKELADGSLMFSFGASLPSGKTRRANDLSSLNAEHITSSKIPYPRRMPSNFQRQSPIPVSAVRKTERHIRNLGHENTDAEKVQDNFGSEMMGETDKSNHSKKSYHLSQRSTSAFAKRSPVSSPDDGSASEMNKASNSSGENDIVALFRRIQSQSAISKENPGNDQKNDTLSSQSKSKKSADSVLSVLRRYPERIKEEFKDETSQKISSIGEDEKMPAKVSSRRGPRKTKSEKTTSKSDKSLSDTFVLSRPPSKFVRSSPIPFSAIKQQVRPVPGIQQSEITFSLNTPTKQNGDISGDSDRTSANVENGSVFRDSPFLSEGQLDDLSHLKLSELKKTAKSYGLKGYSKLKKAELLELLRNAFKQS